MSAVSVTDLVVALRHDVMEVTAHGDTARQVSGVELLDPETGEASGPSQLLLGVGLDLGSTEQTARAVHIAARSSGVLAVKASGPVPRQLLNRAADASVPVVSIGLRVPWSLVQRLVSTLLATHRDGQAREAVLGGDLFTLANATAAAIGGAVAIMDTGRAIIAYSNLPDQPIDETRRRGILGRTVPEEALPDHLAEEIWRSDTVARHQRPGDLPRAAVVIRAGDEVLGSLWAVFPETIAISGCEAPMQQSAKMAALHMLALRRQLDADQDSRNLAFRTALDRPESTDVEVPLPSTLLGLDLPKPAARHTTNNLRLLDLFAQDGRALGHQPALVLSNDRIYALLPIAAGDAIPVETLVAHLHERAARALHLEITTVSSGEVSTLSELRDKRRDVDSALDHLRATGVANGRYTTDELRAELVHKRLLDTVRRDPSLRTGLGERILEHDRRHSTEFGATLLAYLRHLGDVATASAHVLIHQNTLRQRLRRAQDLFDLDFGNPAQRLQLELELSCCAGSVTERSLEAVTAPRTVPR
ncbi:PucR family transcriptional regulator [Amycolatopsis benzoatilytica]|uniref:PucR family transcriptional regulator n=1 Tax=Amycolatopsis benzoatilytica TaxID=346045 RepID=UPI0003687400|nr:helix-turn-helix domain-containing protein [Amycolatopsis benzoatilytica]